MATKVHLSYGSRRFAACDCWTQTSAAGNAARQRLLIAINQGVKRNIRCENWKEILLPTSFIRCEKRHCCQRSAFLGLLQQRGSFCLWCSKGTALCEHLFAFVSSAAWNGQSKCRLCLPWKNICGLPCLCYLCLQSNICFLLRYASFLCYSSTLCSSLSVSVSLNVRFTTIEVCSKTYNRIYVARTNEDLTPYICDVYEFLETNYCMPTRWLTGPLQKSIPPLAQNSGYATDCGWRHFSTHPGAGLPHVGSLLVSKFEGWKGRHFYGGPRAALSLATPVTCVQGRLTLIF